MQRLVITILILVNLKYRTIISIINKGIQAIHRSSVQRILTLEGHDIGDCTRHHQLIIIARTLRHVIQFTWHHTKVLVQQVASSPVSIHKQVQHSLAITTFHKERLILRQRQNLIRHIHPIRCVKRQTIYRFYALDVTVFKVHQSDSTCHLNIRTYRSQLHMIPHLCIASTLLRDAHHDIVIVKIVIYIHTILLLETVSKLLRFWRIGHLLINHDRIVKIHKRSVCIKRRNGIIIETVNSSSIEFGLSV